MALPSAIVDTFTYNGDGQRVQKIDSTGTTKHVWDGQNILLETDGSNIIQVVYTLQPMLYGNLISQRRSGTTSFYLFDGLGSTTQLANSTGSVTDSYLYDSFGNILLTSGSTTNPFRFVGRLGYYYDTDLAKYYLRARFYDPDGGRFVSRDPVLDEADYRYCDNGPTFRQDPFGLASRVLFGFCGCSPTAFSGWVTGFTFCWGTCPPGMNKMVNLACCTACCKDPLCAKVRPTARNVYERMRPGCKSKPQPGRLQVLHYHLDEFLDYAVIT